MPTIQSAIDDYLEMMSHSRSPHTVKTYATGLKVFAQVLRQARLDSASTLPWLFCSH
jgi:site-specific recombinase XerD